MSRKGGGASDSQISQPLVARLLDKTSAERKLDSRARSEDEGRGTSGGTDVGRAKGDSKTDGGERDADLGGVLDGGLEAEGDSPGGIVGWKVEALDANQPLETIEALEHDLDERETISFRTCDVDTKGGARL